MEKKFKITPITDLDLNSGFIINDRVIVWPSLKIITYKGSLIKALHLVSDARISKSPGADELRKYDLIAFYSYKVIDAIIGNIWLKAAKVYLINGWKGYKVKRFINAVK